MLTRATVTLAVVVALAVGMAYADLALDPGSINGVTQFGYVRSATTPDQSLMAWLSAEPFKGGQVVVARSADKQSWAEPVQVSGAYPDWVLGDGGAGEFSLVRASKGAYWLAWSAATQWRAQLGGAHGSADARLAYVAQGPDIWVATSTDGQTWSPLQPVALAPTPDHDPGIIEMPDGRVGVIWVSYRDGNADLSLAFAGSDGTWDQAIQITSDPARDDQYELVHVGSRYTADSHGRLTLAWVSDRSGAPQVWTAVSADGRSWSKPIHVSSTSGDKGFLTIEESPVPSRSATEPEQTTPGYSLYWTVITADGEQRWVSRSPDFAAWSAPELAPVGK